MTLLQHWEPGNTHACVCRPHPPPLSFCKSPEVPRYAGAFPVCLSRYRRQPSRVEHTMRGTELSIWTFYGTLWWWQKMRLRYFYCIKTGKQNMPAQGEGDWIKVVHCICVLVCFYLDRLCFLRSKWATVIVFNGSLYYNLSFVAHRVRNTC